MLMDVHETRLDNDVRVVTSPMPYLQSATIGIWVGVGGRYEPPRISGISHFIEHLLFKGTKKLSSRDITQMIEGRGGYFNAFTQEESTCYYARIAYDHFPKVLDVLSEMYLHPKFDEQDIDKERHVILEELMMYHDQPHHHVHDMLGEAMWSNHSLGRSLIGTPASLDRIDRKAIIDFKDSRYVPGRTVFTFAGRVDHDKCVAQVEALTQGFTKRRRPRFQAVTASVPQERLTFQARDAEQAHLALGFRTFGRADPSRYTLRLLSAVLGENMSSRLFQVVRERHGLAYSIHSSYQLFADTGAFLISAGLDRKELPKAMKLIVRELRRIRDKPVSAAELKRARDYVIGQVRLSMESTTQHVMWMGENLLEQDRVIPPEESISGLETVTPADIYKLAQKVLRPENASLSLIASEMSESAQQELLASLEGLEG